MQLHYITWQLHRFPENPPSHFRGSNLIVNYMAFVIYRRKQITECECSLYGAFYAAKFRREIVSRYHQSIYDIQKNIAIIISIFGKTPPLMLPLKYTAH